MKKFALLSSFLLVAVLTSVTPAMAARHAKGHDAAKATKVGAAADITAEIVSVDAMKKTLSFKNEKGENLTWPVEGAAVESLKTLKAGEKVTLSYAVDAHGAPKAITGIKPAPSKIATN